MTVSKIERFAQSLVGNRVLDLYLKYLGVKTLTVILFQLPLLQVNCHGKIFKECRTKGGAKLPVLDDPSIEIICTSWIKCS